MAQSAVDQDILDVSAGVRRELGLVVPPVNATGLLLAHQLTLPDDPLESVLSELGLEPRVIDKLDAMLDPGEGCVFVRSTMHERQKNWGYMHELGHHVIPWHKELLYRCPIQRLPPKLQKRFEREADEFAADMFFFGSRFVEETLGSPFGLKAPLELADHYDVSLHSAFWRYAEHNPRPCCLLVSKPIVNGSTLAADLELQYYVKSKGFRGHIPPGQLCPATSGLGRLYNSGSLSSCVEHEAVIGGSDGKVYRASSVFNGYCVFTLIWGG